MTIKSVLCVLDGSPEEINTLKANLALADLDQSVMHILPIQERFNMSSDFGNTDKTPEDDENDLDMSIEMAKIMVAAIRQKDECRAADLAARGFTLDEIAKYWDAAAALTAVAMDEDDSSDDEDKEVRKQPDLAAVAS